MGGAISALFAKFSSKEERKMLILGLDNAGKTTLLYKMQLGEVVDTTPTIGFNVESIDVGGTRLLAWDVGGQKKIRSLWRHYYHDTQGLVFVVDSADCGAERMADARDELHGMLAEDGLKGAKVLIFANKQDMRGAVSPSELAKGLGMSEHRGHEWYVQGCCATTGEGVHEGIDWLVEAMKAKKK